MSSVNVNLPKSLHREISQFAEREGISLSQFIAAAAAEKLAALTTEEYLQARASRASREKFEDALAQLPDAEPVERDRL